MFPKIGIPQNGWFITENPMQMDGSIIFGNTHIMTLKLSKENTHPRKLTWKLKIPSWKRRNNYKPPSVGFHVKFQGCTFQVIQFGDLFIPQNFSGHETNSINLSFRSPWMNSSLGIFLRYFPILNEELRLYKEAQKSSKSQGSRNY